MGLPDRPISGGRRRTNGRASRLMVKSPGAIQVGATVAADLRADKQLLYI